MHSGPASVPFRLLLVEDDNELADLLVKILAGEGYAVDLARDGQTGLHLGLTRRYDVMVIDRALPVVDGLSLVRRLRERAITARALLITAMSGVGDLVDGLDAGADDYLIKPFEFKELAARLRALCRRPLELAEVLRIGGGHLDLGTRAAILPAGQRVELSAREFDLLRELAGRPAAVHSRGELRRRVFHDAPSASIVDTYVYYLRRKLGRAAIRTVHSFGYQLGEL
jgi:two-component system, OmpR family, response regulator QseB